MPKSTNLRVSPETLRDLHLYRIINGHRTLDGAIRALLTQQ